LQAKERVEGAEEGLKWGAGLGAALPVAIEGIAASPKAAKWIGQKTGKVFAGVPEETTARYIENPEAINNAPSREEIANKVMNLKKEADEGVAKAHDELQSARQTLSEHKTDVRGSLQDERFETGQKLNEAQALFNEKKQQFKESLQRNNLTHMASEVQGAVDNLKDKVVQGSKDAYAILGKEKGSVDIDPLVKTLKAHHAEQFINGVAKSPEAAQTAQEIRDWQSRLFEMTKKTNGQLSLPQAKEMLQELDQTINYRGKQQSGTFAPATEQALSKLRGEIDQSVKGQSDAYRVKMEEVAEKTGLLNEVSKLYGTPEKAIQNLNNLESEKGQALHVPLLQKLSEHTGKDLREPVAGYLLNQRVLKTPSMFDEIVNGTNEGKAAFKARARMEEVANPDYSRSRIENETSPLRNKIKISERTLDESKDRSKTFSGITPDSITGKTKALNGANKYGAEQRFDKIDSEYGTNFKSDIQNRNDLDQFSKDDTHGSRKSVVGGSLGALLGWIAGKGNHELAVAGYALGHGGGAIADKYSGPIFKKMLDAGVQTGKFSRAVADGLGKLSPGKMTETIERYKSNSKGPEKWAIDGFGKLMNHADEDDQKLIGDQLDSLMKSKNGKKLLISASDLKPGSKAMADIMEKIKSELSADEGGGE
jgi:hypothetical protein